MIPAIKSEFRKLLTIRSTYVIAGICVLLVMLIAGYAEGVRGDAANMLHNPHLLASESTSAILFIGFILALAGLLMAGHEYRYNTIIYTLTAANRRYKVLLARLLVITTFAIASCLFVTFFSPLCTMVGASLAGKEIGPQVFDIWSLVWRCLFCGWAYAMYAFILLMILRSQIGAIVTFLLLPLIGENILGLLLKENVKYLPFVSAQSVVASAEMGNNTTAGHAAMFVLAYVAIGLAVSMVLFQRRDAN